MKKYLLPLSLLLVLVQAAFGAPPSFDSWVGSWKGGCKLTPLHDGIHRQFEASLIIAKKDADRFQWQLIYEATANSPQQIRNYEMVAIDLAKGHYVVDEHNGLLLDSYLDDRVLYSPFTISGKLITATYILISNNEMLMDMPSFNESPARKTCVTGYPELCAESFGLRMTQRCSLTRTK